MIRFYIACILAVGALCSHAAGYRSVAVNQTDGTDVTIELSDEMSAYFADGMFRVLGTPTEVSIPQSSIKSFTFSETSALKSVTTDAPVFDGGMMTFSNLPSGSSVTVVNAAGQIISNARPNGTWTFSLKEYPAGVYLVTVNGVTYKVATRR